MAQGCQGCREVCSALCAQSKGRGLVEVCQFHHSAAVTVKIKGMKVLAFTQVRCHDCYKLGFPPAHAPVQREHLFFFTIYRIRELAFFRVEFKFPTCMK